MSNDKKSKPGPTEERLKIESDDWQAAMRDALKRGKPEPGEVDGESEDQGDDEK